MWHIGAVEKGYWRVGREGGPETGMCDCGATMALTRPSALLPELLPLIVAKVHAKLQISLSHLE